MFSQISTVSAGEWSTDLKTSENKTVSTSSTGVTEKLTEERSLNLSFQTKFDQYLDWTSSFKFTRNKEINDDSPVNTTDDLGVDAGLKSKWWETKATFTQNIAQTGSGVDEDVTYDTAYSFEARVEPEYKNLPRFSYKMDGKDDSMARDYQGSMEYELLKILKFKAETKKNTTDNYNSEETDTDTRSIKGEGTLTLDFWNTWKFETTGTASKDQTYNLTSDGTVIEESEKVTSDASAKISNQPLEWINLDAESLVSKTRDVTGINRNELKYTNKGSVKMTPKPTDAIDLELGFTQNLDQSANTDADQTDLTREYNFAVKWAVLKFLNFNCSYDKKLGRTDPEKSDGATTTTKDDSISLEADLGVWDDQITFSVTQTYENSWSDGDHITNKDNLNFEAKMALKDLPNLEINPSVTTKSDTDRIEKKTERENNVQLDINYTVDIGQVTSIALTHSYGRTETFPSTGPSKISRTDSTKLTANFSDFLRGMKFEAGAERAGKDDSKDDLEPVIDYSYTMKYTWDILLNYSLGVDYKFNDKQDDADDDSFGITFSGKFMKDLATVNASYEKTRTYGESGTKEETYMIEINAKF